MAETTSNKSEESGTAKKSTAKKSTAKKSTAKKSTAKMSTAKKSTARKSTETGHDAGEQPESVFVMAALDAASELRGRIDSAGRELGSQLQAIGGQSTITVPDEVVSALGDAARSNDVAEFLRVQQSYADAVQSTNREAVDAYNEAATTYLKQVEDSYNEAREHSNQLFADYVTAVTDQLRDHATDPMAAAQAGWSLLAIAQLACAQGG